MNTLKLSTDKWDLVLDSNGNLTIAADGEAMSQDAASAILTFQGEVYYDVSLGVPWTNILAELPPVNYVRAQCERAAAAILPDGTKLAVFFSSFTQRLLSGQVQVSDGATTTVANF